MPKSRRDKPLALTKTKKHGRASKERLVEDIRECVASYSSVYVFEVENMRNVKLKELREEWGGSRFFLGKNRVMQLALGKSRDDEPKQGSSKLTPVSSSSCSSIALNQPETLLYSPLQAARVEFGTTQYHSHHSLFVSSTCSYHRSVRNWPTRTAVH